MFRILRQGLAVAALAVLVAACSTAPPERITHGAVPPSAGIYKIGEPYQIDGTWYYPREQPGYDETGVASWYGPTFYGHHTANGEMYDGTQMTAAHRTLPMPVNVRVTNLENGRSVVVRINDRGPYAKGRIIDLSEAAARALDVTAKGTARVRVTYLGRADLEGGMPPDLTPPDMVTAVKAAPTRKVDTAALDIVPGMPAATPPLVAALPLPAPSALIPAPNTEPTGQVTQVPVPAMTHLYVQAGAFSTQANAQRMKTRLAAAGDVVISPIDRGGQRLYRVRCGPYDDVESADAALARLNGLGSNDAQIVVDQ
ncbi:MAG TPA: septal ring lytic transglycosylase RlpA family protein [Rhizomicrobium sp.]|nr:septal ring lytic transglycosylase RlpA family protein [Rhizomicrobium sp.]